MLLKIVRLTKSFVSKNLKTCLRINASVFLLIPVCAFSIKIKQKMRVISTFLHIYTALHMCVCNVSKFCTCVGI